MTPNIPNDRASFDGALKDILADHATLRHLANAVATGSSHSSDDAMSLADAMATHERTEASLFALPFVTKPPKAVVTTGALAQQRCLQYTAGKFGPEKASLAATNFIEALLAHLDAEESWLAEESAHQIERLSIAA